MISYAGGALKLNLHSLPDQARIPLTNALKLIVHLLGEDILLQIRDIHTGDSGAVNVGMTFNWDMLAAMEGDQGLHKYFTTLLSVNPGISFREALVRLLSDNKAI